MHCRCPCINVLYLYFFCGLISAQLFAPSFSTIPATQIEPPRSFQSTQGYGWLLCSCCIAVTVSMIVPMAISAAAVSQRAQGFGSHLPLLGLYTQTMGWAHCVQVTEWGGKTCSDIFTISQPFVQRVRGSGNVGKSRVLFCRVWEMVQVIFPGLVFFWGWID